jgi:hypothetical protein
VRQKSLQILNDRLQLINDKNKASKLDVSYQ